MSDQITLPKVFNPRYWGKMMSSFIDTSRGATYRGSRIDRTTRTWDPHNRPEDEAIRDNFPRHLARTRDLYRNSPSAKRICEVLTDLTVGPGIFSYASPFDPTRILDLDESTLKRDLEYAVESDDRFSAWAENADADGVNSFSELERLAFYEIVNSGDALLMECNVFNPDREISLCYQLVERDQLDRNRDRPAAPGQNRIVNGIEFDRRNRAVAYWLYDAHPNSESQLVNPFESRRIPASRIIHCFLRFRPSQRVGVPLLHAIVTPTRDFDWYIGKELNAAAIAATFLAIHKSERPGNAGVSGDDDTTEDDRGNEYFHVGQGPHIFRGGLEDSFDVVDPKRPNNSAKDFLREIRREQAIGAGISLPRLMADYERQSYTSARASHLDDQAHILPLQRWFGRCLHARVRSRVNVLHAAFGLYSSITSQEFFRERARLNRFEVLGPGREQLDPENETEAAVSRLRSGLSTLKEENGKRQRHWIRLLQQMAAEKRVAQTLGVVLDFSKGQGGQVTSTTTAASDEGEDDQDEF